MTVVLLESLGLILALALCIPFAVLLVESVAAVLRPARAPLPPPADRPPCAVLIPAHNEEDSLGPTLAHLLGQLSPEDRVVVVADNCTDRTAEVARTGGATVLERQDAARRGKGFALDHGIRFLAAAPPAVLVFLGADCTLRGEGVDALVRQVAQQVLPAIEFVAEIRMPSLS